MPAGSIDGPIHSCNTTASLRPVLVVVVEQIAGHPAAIVHIVHASWVVATVPVGWVKSGGPHRGIEGSLSLSRERETASKSARVARSGARGSVWRRAIVKVAKILRWLGHGWMWFGDVE